MTRSHSGDFSVGVLEVRDLKIRVRYQTKSFKGVFPATVSQQHARLSGNLAEDSCRHEAGRLQHGENVSKVKHCCYKTSRVW